MTRLLAQCSTFYLRLFSLFTRTCIWLRRHERIKMHWEAVPVSGNPPANIILNDLSGTMSRFRGVYTQHVIILIKTQHLICDRQPFDVFRCVHCIYLLTRNLLIYVASDATRQTKRGHNDRLLELLALHAALGADGVTWKEDRMILFRKALTRNLKLFKLSTIDRFVRNRSP